MTYLDWISTRAYQSYPLADTATAISTDGTKLGDLFLLDIKLYLPSATGLDLTKFHLLKIVDSPKYLSIILGYNGVQCAISSGIPKDLVIGSDIDERYFSLSPITSLDTLEQLPWVSKLSGSICVGITKDYVLGTLTFSLLAGHLNSNCIHIFSSLIGGALLSIQVGDTVLTGNVVMLAEDGILLTVSGQTIKISMDPQYVKDLLKDSAVLLFGTPVKSINGTLPDSTGNITLRGLDCVSVQAVGNNGAVTITNPCSKPCCDTTDISAIENAIKVVLANQSTLRDYFVNMANNVNYMQANLSTLMSN